MAENLSLQNFDWDAYEAQKQGTKNEEEIQKYNNTLNAIKDNEVVEGTVISINKREVVVNVGYKSDGIVPASEFRYNPDLKVGDKVEVYIKSQEDKKGQLVLSHNEARTAKAWDRVNEAYNAGEIVTGYIKWRSKGGMIVDVLGMEAFLPGSQIDVKPVRDYDILVGKTMEFKIVKLNPEFRNVVVSHKALIEAELEAQKAEIVGKLEKGQVLEGTVKNITNYGVFIDLGGVDGLIHITDLSWGRVNDPHELLQLDQKINVVILDFDEEKKRIALGLKQLTPHPWDALDPNLKVGDKVHGKVVVMADYGAFVEIAEGVEGLVHVSEMSWSQHLRSANDFLKVGDEVDAVILTLDRAERKMSLGIKQLKADPWANVETKYAVGTRHWAKVRNFTNFGVFVEIEEGVDGLIHISDLSWTKKIKHPNEFTQIGAQIEVVTVVNGKVVELTDKGAVVSLEDGVEAFCTTRHLQKEDKSPVAVGDELPFKVIEFNRDAKRILVSHLRTWEERKEAAPKATKKAAKAEEPALDLPKVEKTTLGDLSALADLKASMEAAEEKPAKNLRTHLAIRLRLLVKPREATFRLLLFFILLSPRP